MYILAHDLGTSGNKAVLYRSDGVLAASCTRAYPVEYLEHGGVEQNAEDWWEAVCASTKAVLEEAGVSPSEIDAISFSGHMQGCLPVDAQGNLLTRSLIWADTRSVEQEKKMLQVLGMEEGYRITGHRFSASYTAAKLMWLRDNLPDVYRRCDKVLQCKDYIAYRFTGVMATDYSDASGTNLLDLRTKTWSEEILKELGLDQEKMPELCEATQMIGRVTEQAARECGLCPGIPVVMGGGDGACATVGAGAAEEGMTYCSMGTSSWIARSSTQPVFDAKMRVFNFVGLDSSLYVPCGTMQAGGASTKWFKDVFARKDFKITHPRGKDLYDYLDSQAEQTPPGARGLVFLPYLMGERSPRWNPQARGVFLGIDMRHDLGDFWRAIEEGVAFNMRVILEAMAGDTPISEMTLIGGGAMSPLWPQILADVMGCRMNRLTHLEEAASIGAAICGGVGAGIFPDFSVAKKFNPVNSATMSDPANKDCYQALYEVFNHAYDALVPVYQELDRFRKDPAGV